MIYTLYMSLILFSLIMMILIIFTKINYNMKVALSALCMGLFALLALSSFNVTEVKVIGASAVQVVIFESWDANAMAWINFIFFIISFVMLFVNVLLSFTEMKVPKWKRKLEEHKRSQIEI